MSYYVVLEDAFNHVCAILRDVCSKFYLYVHSVQACSCHGEKSRGSSGKATFDQRMTYLQMAHAEALDHFGPVYICI